MLYSTPSQNAIQKVSTAPLGAGDTSALYLFDLVGVPNLPGILVIDRVTTTGADTANLREYIAYTGTSGSSVIGLTRNVDGGGTDRNHDSGAVVEFVPDVVWATGIYDALLEVVDVNGVLLSSIPKVSPGTSGNLITSNGTMWTSAAPPVSVSVTTKGDIQTFATLPSRLPVGTNGQLLYANVSTSTGLEWKDAPTGGDPLQIQIFS